jgi:steroid delta-isomerase-like uncharacterized protein
VSTEENKALIRRYAEEVWNRGNLDALDEFVSPDYLFTDPSGKVTIRGPRGLKQAVAAIRAVFPDHRLTIEDMIAEDDRVAWRWRMHGTHRGELMGVPPTGRRVTTTGVAVYRIRSGRIVERWGESDVLGLLGQLGALPDGWV